MLAFSGQEASLSDLLSLWWQHAKPIGETLKVWAEAIAYGSGGLFLIYKILSGYFVTDLSVKVACERFSRGQDEEELAVTVSLKKGEKGTVRIDDVRFRLVDQAGTQVSEHPMRGIDRLSFTTSDLGRMCIAFNRTPEQAAWLNLPPGDETQFAGLCRIPADASFLVEVAILGRNLWGRSAQWRASAVSFPKRS